MISINFRPFDESGVINIKDKEKVSEFFEILRNEKYGFFKFYLTPWDEVGF